MNSLNDYVDVVGKKYIEQLKTLALTLQKKKVVMVNSTKDGGGVAEILHRLVPLLNELGIETEWKTISGDKEFFNITKNIHNALQGQRICFTKQMLDYYLDVNKKNSENFEFNEDFVFIHDPQPLALIKYFNKNKSKWIWRCHIDLSKPDLKLWKFLKQYLLQYDASIFSIAKFSRVLPHPQYLVAPSIDPLSDKNRELSKEEIDKVVSSFQINLDKPIILQVSRFDRFKGPLGVIEAYRMVKKEINCQLILAGGEASDDPEGKIVFEEVLREAGDDPDIKVLLLKPNSNIEINALQRISDVVIQNSSKEGFGLVVTEAMWKGKPVVGGAAGGITIQIINHQTGFLIYSTEGAAFRIRYLLNRKHVSEKMGKLAKEYVLNNFLITRHLRDYLSIMIALENENKYIIQI